MSLIGEGDKADFTSVITGVLTLEYLPGSTYRHLSMLYTLWQEDHLPPILLSIDNT